MNKEDIVKFWQKESKDNLNTAEYLFKGKKYRDCLFFCHLSLEKYLKSKVVNQTKNEPPPIHNLIRLAEKAQIKLDPKIADCLAEINTFNIEARYDTYKHALFKKATLKFTSSYLKITQNILKWLKNK